MHQYYVYVMASERNGTLYIGVTSNLVQRVYQHRSQTEEGFTKKYHVHMLAYYEVHTSIEEAILREKQLKKWKRLWKLSLIEGKNPKWKDLYPDII